MGKDISGIVRKTLYVLMLVFFVMSTTAGAVTQEDQITVSEVIDLVIVYELTDFGGRNLSSVRDQPYVGDDWNDKISSIMVESGTWRFYEYPNYGGRYWDLGTGNYSSVESVGIPDDSISSFKHI